MTVTKAENMIIHSEEIMSRPKRTWFVTETEKQKIKRTGVFFESLLTHVEASKEQFEMEEGATPEKPSKKERALKREVPVTKRVPTRRVSTQKKTPVNTGREDDPGRRKPISDIFLVSQSCTTL
jgi:hypothetical protein